VTTGQPVLGDTYVYHRIILSSLVPFWYILFE